jgi:hypothetical protein
MEYRHQQARRQLNECRHSLKVVFSDIGFHKPYCPFRHGYDSFNDMTFAVRAGRAGERDAPLRNRATCASVPTWVAGVSPL